MKLGAIVRGDVDGLHIEWDHHYVLSAARGETTRVDP
jgi:hypothetical protein